MVREATSGCSNKPLKFKADLGTSEGKKYKTSARMRRNLARQIPAELLSSDFGKHFACMGVAATSLPPNLIVPDEDI